MKEQAENPETPQTDNLAIFFSGMLEEGGSNEVVNSNSSTEEKIQKSRAHIKCRIMAKSSEGGHICYSVQLPINRYGDVRFLWVSENDLKYINGVDCNLELLSEIYVDMPSDALKNF